LLCENKEVEEEFFSDDNGTDFEHRQLFLGIGIERTEIFGNMRVKQPRGNESLKSEKK
jgi:hypothetical protein